MNVSEFTNSIHGKLFVEITNQDMVTAFTANPVDPQESNGYRDAADAEGVIVFLTTIHKIYTKGFYYGGDFDGILSRLTTVEQQIASLGTPLANLVSRVAQNESDISDINNLIGDASTANSILGKIAAIENELTTITGGQTIGEAVDTYLAQVLDSKVAELGYVKSTDTSYTTLQSDVSTLQTTLGTVQSALSEKASQVDFSALVTKLGTDNWNTATDGGTVVTVINDLRSTTQTLTTNYNSLSNAVSGIPRFQIQVTTADGTTGLPNVATPDPATIYLVVSPEDEQEGNNEMYTEYIYINRNAGKYDNQDPPQPLAPNYQWEKLGRQAFKMNNYLDADQIEDIIGNLETTINNKIEGLNADKIAQITTNQTNISNLQTAVQSIQTSLGYLYANGEYVFTGEDIKTTTDTNSNTIATDIANLQSSKLNADAINWVVINQQPT